MNSRPNVLLILNDDMGYSDLGCYGGEVHTPTLDALAEGGLRYTQFYNTARCCPSRASLLTGLYPHQADVGAMVRNDDVDGYLGDLSKDCVTIAEVLQAGGYRTMMSGKWHVTGRTEPGQEDNWPCQRGFDRFYGTLRGAASYFDPHDLYRNNEPIRAPRDQPYYFTDAISDEAVRQLKEHFHSDNETPFFQYVAYTAPHWPLHALEEDVERYRGRYDCGWDAVRENRLARMQENGLLEEGCELSERDPQSDSWDHTPDKEWEAKRMEVYAAQIDRMDQGIGRIVDTLRDQGQLENTLIIFLADNGGCAEVIQPTSGESIVERKSGRAFTRDGRPVRYGNTPEVVPGPEDTYASYGLPWANASNTPFRKFKCWVHEGGISTPFILHWPEGISDAGAFRRSPAQLPDVMATILDVTGVTYPLKREGIDIQPHEGFSLVPSFQNHPHERMDLAWEHEGCCGFRRGDWKLVREFQHPWELYHIATDRSEMHDLADEAPARVAELTQAYQAWADRCGVRPWQEILVARRMGNAADGTNR